MCTVTFSPRKGGYALAMNRDEKLTRIPGFAPARKTIDGCDILAPSEPGGGTWIALNEGGTTLALINWYAVDARINLNPISRGQIVNATCTSSTPEQAQRALVRMPLPRVNPFRLIGIFPATNEIVEWRWDLKKLVPEKCSWQTQQWVSSGFDERSAQQIRGKLFEKALGQKSACSRDWLWRLHRSHVPVSGPFSVCMHRDDAATVSYTEVAVLRRELTMRHHHGAPCTCNRDNLSSMMIPRLELPGRRCFNQAQIRVA